MKIADRICHRLLQVHGNPDMVLPNYYFNSFECDVLRITPKNVSYEYEIKISRSDFLNDFKKTSFGLDKHHEIQSGRRTNFFYFVVPEGLVQKEELPEDYGLIYFKYGLTGIGLFETVKLAKRLHKDKFDTSTLARSMFFRERSIREKYFKFKSDHADLPETIKEIERLKSLARAREIRIAILEADPEYSRWIDRMKLDKDYLKHFPDERAETIIR